MLAAISETVGDPDLHWETKALGLSATCACEESDEFAADFGAEVCLGVVTALYGLRMTEEQAYRLPTSLRSSIRCPLQLSVASILSICR